MVKSWAIWKWNEVFESATSRKLQRLDYVCVPTNHDSERYERLMESMPGAAAFGHFRAMVDYAATLPCRGLFVRSGAAMTIDQIARRIFIPTNHLRRSWPILTAPEVGWLIEVEVEPSGLPGVFVLADGNLPRPREKSATDPPVAREKSPGSAGEISRDGGGATRARANPPTHPKNPPQDNPPTNQEPAGFSRFWRAWPSHERKANRRGCLKIWDARQLETQTDAIVASIAKWQISRAWCDKDGQFIPAPMVWLNQERWLVDDIPEADEGDQPGILRRPMSEVQAAEMLGLIPGGGA